MLSPGPCELCYNADHNVVKQLNVSENKQSQIAFIPCLLVDETQWGLCSVAITVYRLKMQLISRKDKKHNLNLKKNLLCFVLFRLIDQY